jgi:hypothetical protein
MVSSNAAFGKAVSAQNSANFSTRFRQASTRYRSKLNGGTGRIIVTGCSIEYGLGATSNNGYIQQLATTFASNGQWSHYAWQSHPMSSYLWAPNTAGVNIGATMAAVTPLITDLFIGGNPTNDIFGLSAYNTDGASYQSSIDLTQMQRRMMAVASYYCVPETNRVRAVTTAGVLNPAITRTGTWNNGYTSFSATDPGVAWSAATGASQTITSTSGNFIIVRVNTSQSATGTFTITIDGVSKGTFSSSATYDFWATDCFMFSVPYASSHTVVITQTGGDNVLLRHVDCFDTTTDYSATFMYMLPCDQSPLGWSAGQSTRGGANSSIAAGYCTSASGCSVSGNTLTTPTPDIGRFCEGQSLTATGGTGALASGTRITQRISTNPVGSGSGAGIWRIDPAATTNGTLTGVTATFPGAIAVLENSALARFRAGFDEAMQSLINLGMNIVKVPAHVGYNPSVMQSTSQAYLHPNDVGHLHLYHRWVPYLTKMLIG